jgi:2-hydroxy-3-keto-5-methylthiopentenyl-1-phosphate phosphatase
MKEQSMNPKKNNRYLVASDFDQTLSFNDSGRVLADIVGVPDFEQKVKGLAATHLVQQGAELAYLLRHDPAFRRVRREHLIEAGKQVRLKNDVALLGRILGGEIDGARFQFVVISAAPREVVQSALEGIVPADNVLGTELAWDPTTHEISSVDRVTAGYGKVAILQEQEHRFETSPDHTVYIGDGSSDLYVMHHVNSRDGLTIAVSESKDIGRIARRTVLSDNATSVLAPMLEDALGWDAHRIRALYEANGLAIQGWDKVRTDWLTLHHANNPQEVLVA